MRLSVFRVEADRVFKIRERFLNLALPRQGMAEIILRHGIGCSQAHRFAQMNHRIVGAHGLGAREASMYALLLAITTEGPALGVTLVNRLAITLVEVLLFGAGLVTWRLTRSRRA